jgi:putative transferase (TIGR04331 family)
LTRKLFLHPDQYKIEEIQNSENIFLFPSALLDKENIQFHKIAEESLINFRFSVNQFDQEFSFTDNLTNKITLELIPLFNEYYAVKKSNEFWFTILLADLREIIEIVYVRFLQLHSVSDSVSVELVKNSDQFLKYETGRLFYLNTNFISTVDWALSSYIIEKTDLVNRFDCQYRLIKKCEKPAFDRDWSYYSANVRAELNRVASFQKHWFPYYVSFQANNLSVHLDYDEQINKEFCKFGDESSKFFAYYSGFPRLKPRNRKVFFKKLRNRFQHFTENSFESFFINNFETFFPDALLNLRIPLYSNFQFLKIGMPSSSVLEAESRENGGKVFGIQHGTAYGMYKNGTQEWSERSVSDGFISWGWTEKEGISPIIPLPSPMLSKLIPKNKLEHSVPKDTYQIGVIFNTTYNRVGKLLRIAMPFFLKDNLRLLNDILRTLDSLPQKEIVVSEYAYEQGYDIKLQIDENLRSSPDLKFESMVGEKLIKDSILLISNSFGTSFFERLVLNKPIIIFNDFFELENFNSLWRELVELLISAGIYMREGDSFRSEIGKSTEEVLKWWNSDLVQNARMEILNQYVRINENWKNDFHEFICMQLEKLPVKSTPSKVPEIVKFYSRIYFRLKQIFVLGK